MEPLAGERRGPRGGGAMPAAEAADAAGGLRRRRALAADGFHSPQAGRKNRAMKARIQPRVRTKIGTTRRAAVCPSRRGGVARFAATIWWVKAVCQRRNVAAYQRVMVRK